MNGLITISAEKNKGKTAHLSLQDVAICGQFNLWPKLESSGKNGRAYRGGVLDDITELLRQSSLQPTQSPESLLHERTYCFSLEVSSGF